MTPNTIIALTGMIAAFAGVATGIVALRKVGTENAVAIRSVASTEADATLEGMRKFNEALRIDNAQVHEQLRLERELHNKTKDELAIVIRRLHRGDNRL